MSETMKTLEELIVGKSELVAGQDGPDFIEVEDLKALAREWIDKLEDCSCPEFEEDDSLTKQMKEVSPNITKVESRRQCNNCIMKIPIRIIFNLEDENDE